MKAFARLDVIIQVILIVSGLAIGFGVMAGSISGDYMFVPYFMVGGWQIFSVIVHLVGEGFRFSPLRKAYLSTLILVLVILIISIPAEFIIYALIGLLFFSPLMAFFYLYTCNKELKSYQDGNGEVKIATDDAANAGSPPNNGSTEAG
jgi:hypothetical protein